MASPTQVEMALLALSPPGGPAPGLEDKALYKLVVVDEATGSIVRAATDDDVAGLDLQLQDERKDVQSKRAKHKTLQQLLEEARQGDGPVCDHCGTTGALGSSNSTRPAA